MKITHTPSVQQMEEIQKKLQQDMDSGINTVYVEDYRNPIYIGVEESGSLIGIASIAYSNEMAELYKLYVLPNYRKKDIATTLVNETITILKNRGNSEVVIEISGKSIYFWQKYLQNKITERFTDDKFSIHI